MKAHQHSLAKIGYDWVQDGGGSRTMMKIALLKETAPFQCAYYGSEI